MASTERITLYLDEQFKVRRSQPVPSETRVHPDVELNFIWSGSVRVLYGAGQLELAAGRLVVFWAGIPHRVVEAADRTDLGSIAVPVPWFSSLGLDPSFVRKLFTGEALIEPRMDAMRSQADAYQFEQWVLDLRSRNIGLQLAAVEEIAARLRRLSFVIAAQHQEAHLGRSARVRRPRPIDKVTQLVADRYQHELSIPSIARAVGLHPNYLMALFARTFGMSLWEYVVRVRVSHAQRLLVSTSLNSLDIAIEAGFGSKARFHAAFKRHTGLTPLAFRALHRLR